MRNKLVIEIPASLFYKEPFIFQRNASVQEIQFLQKRFSKHGILCAAYRTLKEVGLAALSAMQGSVVSNSLPHVQYLFVV